MSVILAEINETDQPKKARSVEIYKSEVYKDIEHHTFKYMDASGQPDVKIVNAVQADTAEDLDGAMISRYVEFRDAKLRMRLQGILVEKEADYADDQILQEDNMYRYHFLLPATFNDNALRSLAEYIHRFLVFGALYDWYSQFGHQQAAVYGTQLYELEKEITGLLRGPSIAKRPMQPFGPANKFM